MLSAGAYQSVNTHKKVREQVKAFLLAENALLPI